MGKGKVEVHRELAEISEENRLKIELPIKSVNAFNSIRIGG